MLGVQYAGRLNFFQKTSVLPIVESRECKVLNSKNSSAQEIVGLIVTLAMTNGDE